MRQPPAPTTDAVNRLIQELNRLPGIGPKSAQRLAYYLLRAAPDQVHALAESILSVKAETHLCANCYNITDSDLCLICRNEQRDRSRVLVVEQPQDILAIERTGIYKGLYFVLHGALSPTEGIGPDDLKIKELIERLKESIIKEVIIATNPTMEGEQTALYLKRLIAPLGVKVTRLARGLPFGSELEYADDVTLTRAIEGRQEI